MDRLIRRFDATKDEDLMVCPGRGVAYQCDMSKRIEYGNAYLAAYQALAGSPVEQALNAGRVAMLSRHAAPGARVLDVGVGNGSFLREAVKAGFDARGTDINPAAVEWLRAESLLAEDARGFDVVTLWDSIEHMDAPEVVLKRIGKGGLVIAAIPLVDLANVRASKHYKPGEHLYYWTEGGFVAWMAMYGFRLLESSAHEVEAGRESIGAFAFRRDLPDYDDHIAAYREMHETRLYGNSSTELYLRDVTGVVRRTKPGSILDYGCGRSDLVAHFYRDGERQLGRYDPAIRKFRHMPEGVFDLVLCCDVMEHIPIASVDRVLAEVRAKGRRAFFAISMKLARAKLPDGRNAHVTLLTRGEWTRWIADYFGAVTEMTARTEHELLLVAGGA